MTQAVSDTHPIHIRYTSDTHQIKLNKEYPIHIRYTSDTHPTRIRHKHQSSKTTTKIKQTDTTNEFAIPSLFSCIHLLSDAFTLGTQFKVNSVAIMLGTADAEVTNVIAQTNQLHQADHSAEMPQK